MKRILSAVALLLILASTSWAQNTLAQWVTRDKTFYTTTWDSIAVTNQSYQTVRIIASNDSGTGTIIVACQNDTTSTRWVTVKAGEVVPLPPVNNTKFLRVKALTSVVHGSVWVF